MEYLEKRPRIGAGLLLLLVILAFSPALRGGFMWDDDAYISNNPQMTSSRGLAEIWTGEGEGQYNPVLRTAFWLQYRLWGPRPLGYHAVNILLHACNALLLFVFLQRWGASAAWIGAALFALHPLQVESVAWITEQKNTLSMLFFLLSLLWYPLDKKKPGNGYWLALLFFALGLLTKALVMTLPILLLLLAWQGNGRLDRSTVLRTLPMFLMSLALAIVFTRTERAHGWAASPASEPGTLEALLISGRAFWFYLVKLLWPANLCLVYPRWEISTASWIAYVPLVFMVLALVALWRCRAGKSAMVAAAFYLLFILPSPLLFSINYMKHSFVADHFVYLPSAVILAVIASSAVTALRKIQPAWTQHAESLFAAALLVLGILTWGRAALFTDQIALWKDVVDRNPEAAIGYRNMAQALATDGRIPEALALARKALEFEPEDPVLLHGLAQLYQQLGDTRQARGYYERALHYAPPAGQGIIHNNLGALLLEEKAFADARPHLEEAARLLPRSPHVAWNMGRLAVFEARFAEAIPFLQKARAIQPNFTDLQYDLAFALRGAGRMDEALEALMGIRSANPADCRVYKEISTLLIQMNRPKDAADMLMAGRKPCPDDPVLLNNLGTAYYLQGLRKEAVRAIRQALAIDPEYREAQLNLAVVTEQDQANTTH